MKKLSIVKVTQQSDGISRIKLNNPSTYNALSLAMLKLLIKSFKIFI